MYDVEENEEPFSWEIDTSLLPPLFAAADRFAQETPWQYLSEEPPVQVALEEHGPEAGVSTLYGAVLGNDELVTGLAAYYTLEGYQEALREELEDETEPGEHDVNEMIETLRQMGAPVDEMPPDELKDAIQFLMEQLSEGGGVAAPENINSLLMYLNTEEETDPTYLEWLQQHNIHYAAPEYVPYFLRTDEEGDVRALTAGEVKALTLTLTALNEFFVVERPVLDADEVPEEPVEHEARIGSGTGAAVVTVSFPPAGYEWEGDEDDDEDEDEDVVDDDGNLTGPGANGHN
ncbi:MAG: hypothetical protein ACHQ4H_00725 [Ktedonobacterales bacterium]